MGTRRGTGAQRGLTLGDARRRRRAGGGAEAGLAVRGGVERSGPADGLIADGPSEGLLPLPAGGAPRVAWMLAPVWHAGFAVLSVLGALHAGPAGTLAPLTATVLYGIAGALFTAVALLLVALRVQGTRGGAVPLVPVQAAYLTTPVASAVLLTAAYVTRVGDGPFIGGFGAMVALIVGLVLLAQRTVELQLGSAGPVSERRTPTAPVTVVPGGAGAAGADRAAAGAGAGAASADRAARRAAVVPAAAVSAAVSAATSAAAPEASASDLARDGSARL
ncbi:hypothetical protein [Frigoribacterium faeni]|uniref:hypothetical protein n=1 Tax=Frigoribacterium faeni TaxID=145483 RepID=UPI00141B402E|nr:hypothetical protein [Frigoribacterium faeni]NIJ04748.1 hypothetical protein [Frigoribacterium faeni]